MGDLILSATAVFQLFVLLITLYYLIISFFGLPKIEEESSDVQPEKTFALIVAAHNEELVIGQSVESLKHLDYPSEMYDVFVIADNCNDRTAEIASKHGAIVCERTDAERRGKGYALEWMFEKLFDMEKKYDAVVVFDADNLASKNFLKEMNCKLKKGYKVIQGYIDSKNPHDSWISESYSISFWTANRLFQSSRARLGLSNQIGGTGFCVETELLKEFGWGSTCLTEDLEFTCKLVLNGYKVGWAHNAVVYDEKPLTLKQSWKQRKRWMQGFTDVASRFFRKLIKRAIVKRDFVALDCALYTVQPFVVIILGISAILTFLQANSEQGLNIFVINYLFDGMGSYGKLLWQLFCIFQFLFTPFVMVLERKLGKKMLAYFGLYSLNIFIIASLFDSSTKSIVLAGAHVLYFMLFAFILIGMEGKHYFKVFVWYILYGVYTLTWIPITIQGILNKNNKEWSHTQHTRQISIKEIENVDGRSAA